jgi:hypothetical protein
MMRTKLFLGSLTSSSENGAMNPDPCLGHAQTCGRLNRLMESLATLIIGSSTTI